MASISREKNWRRTIQFVGPDKKRRSIRLGKVTQKQAESVKTKVEHLVEAQHLGVPLDNETASWVATLSDELHEKLAAVGCFSRGRKTFARWKRSSTASSPVRPRSKRGRASSSR